MFSQIHDGLQVPQEMKTSLDQTQTFFLSGETVFLLTQDGFYRWEEFEMKDIIVLDLKWPSTDGAPTLRLLPSSPPPQVNTPSTVFILLSLQFQA